MLEGMNSSDMVEANETQHDDMTFNFHTGHQGQTVLQAVCEETPQELAAQDGTEYVPPSTAPGCHLNSAEISHDAPGTQADAETPPTDQCSPPTSSAQPSKRRGHLGPESAAYPLDATFPASGNVPVALQSIGRPSRIPSKASAILGPADSGLRTPGTPKSSFRPFAGVATPTTTSIYHADPARVSSSAAKHPPTEARTSRAASRGAEVRALPRSKSRTVINNIKGLFTSRREEHRDPTSPVRTLDQ